MSEWGKIDSGQPFTVVVDDVGAAIACANFREYEAILVERVKRETWGQSRKRKLAEAVPYHLNIRKLSRELGCTDQRLYGAKYRLLKARVFIEKDCGVLINKEAHEWIDPDSDPRKPKPLLSPERLAYARSMRTHSAQTKRPTKPIPETDAFNADELIANKHTFNADALNADALNDCTQLTPMRYAPNADALMHLTPKCELSTIEDRVRDSEDFRKNEEDAGSTHAGDPEPFETPTKPGEVPPIITGPGPDDPEIKALAEWAAQTRGEYSGWVLASSPYAPARWIRSLLARRVVGKPRPANVKLLAHILGEWIDKGQPEWDMDADPAPTVNGPAPTPHDRKREAKQRGVEARKANTGGTRHE